MEKMDAETSETNARCPHCQGDLSKVIATLEGKCKETEGDTADSLLRRNKRLSDKLEQSKGYAEELRAQVLRLTKEIGDLKIAKSRSVSTASQFDEADAKKAEDLSRYGYAVDGDRGGEQEEQDSKWDPGNPSSIAEQAREAAEEATRTQSMVYEETSGLYYDYNSGYYYDAERRLYYDGSSGTWYRYNYGSGEYEVHSVQEKKVAAKKRKRRDTKDLEEDGELEEGTSEESDDDELPPCMRLGWISQLFFDRSRYFIMLTELHVHVYVVSGPKKGLNPG